MELGTNGGCSWVTILIVVEQNGGERFLFVLPLVIPVLNPVLITVAYSSRVISLGNIRGCELPIPLKIVPDMCLVWKV